MTATWKSGTAIALLTLCVAAATSASFAADGHIEGWLKTGEGPDSYVIGTEPGPDGNVAYLRSLDAYPDQYGVLVQFFTPGEYLGRRVRLTARVRTEEVERSCVLFLRADRDQETVSFDNMADRPLHGTSDWRTCTIVLDVPSDADAIFLGMILVGRGKALLDDVALEIVDRDVPLTGLGTAARRSGPANLDFEE